MKSNNKDLKTTANNTIMLYILAFVKLVLPLITLPYLTRVLSQEAYGTISYVKACMVYMQLIVDFGFILSSVKDIVKAQGNKDTIGVITGHTYLAKTFLVGISFLATLMMSACIPILRDNITFTLLSFLSVATTAYIADFLFRGLEKMHIITTVFLIARSVSTVLTFVLVHNDDDILFVPILEIIAHIISILVGQIWITRLNIKIKIESLRQTLAMLKESFTYFLSGVATTVFTALSTLLIGIVIVDLKQIAYWGVCTQIIFAIQGLYAPIMNGIYPYMIKKRSLSFIHKILLWMMPVVTMGCILCFFLSDIALWIVGGESYVAAENLFRCLIPILLFSFPAQLYGWPTLGAIGLVKQTTMSTIIAAVVQVLGLALLIMTGTMTLYTVAVLKCFIEFLFMAIRMYYTYSNRDKFLIAPIRNF